ncbi:dual specificity protein phosphatase 1-like isoform X2 [Abrus precatorius]|uniref:protein-tyrosine-phosphatase n=1 Tax=Abrus precatorius TaxID=3816 RepID=A0A8B8JM27_ABRPR|nr:dual specificity protein phosphatase 1-like isoform X2 [Abrus precatorius]
MEKSGMAASAAMDQFDKSMKKQIEAIARVLHLVKSYKEDCISCKIDEGLYLGSVGAATNKFALKKFNITHILTVAGKLPPAHPGDFVYKVIDARRHGGGVLVHCFAGRSRSVTVIVAYLMKTRGMCFSEALRYVESKRPAASPNRGFIDQLKDFEKSLQGAPKLH